MFVTEVQAASDIFNSFFVTNTVELIQKGTYSIKEFVKQSSMIRMKALFVTFRLLVSSKFTEMIIIYPDNSAAALSSVRYDAFCKAFSGAAILN